MTDTASSFTLFKNRLLAGRRRGLLWGLLAVLHGILLLGQGSSIGRSLLVVHFGLFLLWQPFVHSKAELQLRHLFLFFILIATFVWQGWWVLILWLILLGGIIGGRVFFSASLKVRLFYLLAFADLICSLLFLVVPSVLPGTTLEQPLYKFVVGFLIPIILLVMFCIALLEGEEAESASKAIDLIYSLMAVLFLSSLVFGCISVMQLNKLSYVDAVLNTVLTMAGMLLVLALVWQPRAGFSGVGALLSRYILAEGLPFDSLLRDLTTLSREQQEPRQFAQEACVQAMHYMPWVNGGAWSLRTEHFMTQGKFGVQSGVVTRYSYGEFLLEFHTHSGLPPTLAWNTKLMSALLAEFCLSKARALQLREVSYMQAVYETGSRLTHDVKNLLQSLNTLCAASNMAEKTSDPNTFNALLKRQLPAITQRLQQTMNKLQHPMVETKNQVEASVWWQEVVSRHEQSGIAMHASNEALKLTVPAMLFDSALDNLIQNAIDKRMGSAGLQINVQLLLENEQPALQVSDDGRAIDSKMAEQIGQFVLSSENGLGIGLFQVHRQALAQGYELRLTENEEGRVVFLLASKACSFDQSVLAASPKI